MKASTKLLAISLLGGLVVASTTLAQSTIRLSSATYSVNENDGAAAIQVFRTGDVASGSAQVDFTTADGSATNSFDYTTTSGRLTFAAGERFKRSWCRSSSMRSQKATRPLR